MIHSSPFLPDNYWIPISDGNETAFAIYMRHYSARPRKAVGNYLIGGPGEKTLLLTFHCDALFGWRKFDSMDGQEGISCFVYRNEAPKGKYKSSDLIAEADELAWRRWPGERLYTYVHPGKVRSSNPGCCFKKAGWRVCGQSKRGLIILEKLP